MSCLWVSLTLLSFDLAILSKGRVYCLFSFLRLFQHPYQSHATVKSSRFATMSSSDNSHVGRTLQDFQGWESMYQSALRQMDETGTDYAIAFMPDPRPGKFQVPDTDKNAYLVPKASTMMF